MDKNKVVRLELNIKSCSECPYCEYDSYYDRVRDSGYDCKLAFARIIDDWEWDNSNNPNRLGLKYEMIPIPNWCPLLENKDKN